MSVPTWLQKRNSRAAVAPDAPAKKAPEPGSISRWGSAWLVLLIVGLTFTLITLPRLPLGSDDDSSWSAVLGYAHSKGLQFGKDIAFTYGPFGFLLTPYFCPSAPVWRFLTDVGLSLSAAAGVCLLAWRLSGFWRWGNITAFLFLAGNAEPRSELLLNLSLVCWGLLCLVEKERRVFACAAALAALSVFAALGKVSFLFTATLVLLGVAGDWYLKGKGRRALVLLAGSAGGLFLAWLMAGQSPANLGKFLAQAAVFSNGYAAAMQSRGFSVLTWTAIGVAALTLGTIALYASQWTAARWRRGVLLIWLSAWVFLIWKHGFVRTDRDHVEVFFGSVPVLALLVEAVSGAVPIARYLARSLGLAACLLSLFAWQWLFAGDLKSCLARPFRLAGSHAHMLLHPLLARDRQRELQVAETEAMQLPKLRERIGASSVDVFGFNQSYAVFNELYYRPRPVFQSYAAYSASLMRLNEEFYLSPADPEFVLFRLNPMDDRFPPLEDAPLLRLLLQNYVPVDAEGPFLLLKSAQRNQTGLEPILEGKSRPGQLIDLQSYANSDLWMEVELAPSLLGEAATLMYQASPVELGVWIASGGKLRQAKFRAPAPMLAAGFLASPLVLDNQDMLDLYTSRAVTRPVAFSVELDPGTRRYWEDSLIFRLYRITSRLGRSAPPDLARLLQYPGFDLAPAAIVAPTNAVIQIRGRPALYLPPGSYMRFEVPAKATRVIGSFGFAPGAYAFGGGTEGAEFRIEEALPDGRMQTLHSRILRPRTNPTDRGLQAFSLECPGEGQRQVLLRIIPLAGINTPRDITCWADIGFQ